MRLVTQAMVLGISVLPKYSSPYSRHDFTQPQLFAVLVLKYFLKLDYRGVEAVLKEWSELRQVLGMKKVPDHSTLCYAQQRLLEGGGFERLQAKVFEQAQQAHLIDAKPTLAIDATGLESRHVSAHYVDRKGSQRFKRMKWPKLTAVTHTTTHLIAGAVVGQGPSQDSPQFPAAIRQAATHLHPDRVLGDKGYDAEHNHRLCREELGIRSTIFPINTRNRGRKWPKAKYRRQMRRRFFKRKYRQRWQVESVFSRHKRRLGSALTARSETTQNREILLRVITHNLMILKRTSRGFQQSNTGSKSPAKPLSPPGDDPAVLILQSPSRKSSSPSEQRHEREGTRLLPAGLKLLCHDEGASGVMGRRVRRGEHCGQ
jgi:hypothetical protein